ncbi:germination protein YpeB [Pseudalkalibacillus salsuginis]|uniref:germination protein YpeB n=1 Tax=Pseudalkalibacillus salsuginis TaxID=2910972 RepID=UPI001F3396A1|nr:germination protein YpeB [Pseudalkalibacillus salsuginis]MCF6408250.1 germination protein YpeB [Pseudalkalibacillus salsuginis]
MIRTILITILAIAVIGTGYWGYKEHQEKNAILINAENNYQRAFHDLNFHIDALEEKIGTTLAMNSRQQISPSLAEVWRLTSEAHNDVGQLPLALLPFNKTEEFLTKIGEFSYRIAIRDLEKDPLSKDEYATLGQLHKNATEIKNELRNVQATVMKENLRWMDVELALATENDPMDNTVINGLKTVDKSVEGYSEVNWGPEMTKISEFEDNKYKALSGKEITKQEAKNLAIKFLKLNKNSKVIVEENGKGSPYEAYRISVNEPKSDSNIYLEMTKKGGHPTWILEDRNVEDAKISLYQGREKAEEFLKKHAMDKMEMSTSDQYENIGIYTYVKKQDDVRIYPQTVTIKVALDNGDIIGYEGMNYLIGEKDRQITTPAISQKEAQGKLNPKLKIMETHQGIIRNDLGEEVQCYEFLATMGNETFRIFINASTGMEEKVKKLDDPNTPVNSM